MRAANSEAEQRIFSISLQECVFFSDLPFDLCVREKYNNNS